MNESSVLILSYPMPNTKLGYLCTTNGFNNFVSYDSKCEGQKVIGPLGYFYNSPTGQFTTALYRCYSPSSIHDHMHSTDINFEVPSSWKNEMLIGYVRSI